VCSIYIHDRRIVIYYTRVAELLRALAARAFIKIKIFTTHSCAPPSVIEEPRGHRNGSRLETSWIWLRWSILYCREWIKRKNPSSCLTIINNNASLSNILYHNSTVKQLYSDSLWYITYLYYNTLFENL